MALTLLTTLPDLLMTVMVSPTPMVSEGNSRWSSGRVCAAGLQWHKGVRSCATSLLAALDDLTGSL
jgi:hypothetical protein